MTGQLEKVDRLWPDRGIFQGSGRAYLRYAERSQPVWEYVEKPLWEHVFAYVARGTTMTDFGAGSGKLERLALSPRASGRPAVRSADIVAIEPNPILARELRKRFPGVRCRRSGVGVASGRRRDRGSDLIVSNMVIHHLDTPAFVRMFRSVMRHLSPDGIFAFTVPDPLAKAKQLRPESLFLEEFTAEEPAPWGGLTRYHHRSVPFYENFFIREGVCFDFVQYGFEDTMQPLLIRLLESETGKSHRGPRRLMVYVRKQDLVPDVLRKPPSLRGIDEVPYPMYGPVDSLRFPAFEVARDPHEK